MTGLHNYQSSLQEHHQLYLGQLDNNHPVMDELLDQIFSLPSWADVGGGLGKVPWDHHPGGLGANPVMDSSGDLQGTHKLFTMSLLPPGLLSDAFNDRGLGSQERESEDAMENGESNQYCNNDINFVSRLQQHERQESEQAPVGGLPFNDSTTLNLVSQTIGSSQQGSGVRRVNSLPPLHLMNGRGSLQLNSSSSIVSNGSPLPLLTSGSNLQNLAMLPRSSSVRSSRSEGSADAYHCLSPPPTAPVICQSYTGGSSPLPFSLGQNNPGNLLETGETPSGDAPFLGKRSRSEEVPLKEHQPNQDNLPATQGIVSPTYGTAAAQAQGPSPAIPVTGFNSARPRVRARRGQATDPHSIAERLRRERIAERMKSLQELVPNSNKTDKASMLEEIIDYVKFLQLQVKVLSMSRLGGACAVSQVINDLPSEGPSAVLAATLGRCSATSGPLADGLALTEHQVSRLMEEDMGTAMQYLQSKGLCLMPISLASAISSTGTKSKAINQGASGVTCDDKVRSHPQAVTIPVSGSLAVAGRAASFTVGSVGDESDSGTKVGSDEDKQLKGCIELNLGEMSNGFRDAKASRSPKSGVKSSAEEFHRQSQQ